VIGVPPAFVLFAAALLLPFLPLAGRRVLTVAAPLLALPLMLALPEGESWIARTGPFELVWARSDALSRLFGLAFLFATAAIHLYGMQRRRTGEQAAGLLYAGGALAVVFAGDLLSMLFAWEVAAVASTLLVAARRTPAAVAAAQRYLMVHLGAGAILLVGVLLLGQTANGFAFDSLRGLGAGAWLVLAAFCVNAAVPPLHAWLPDAYPESTPAGSVLLATYTTKAAVYCLLRGFAGEEALAWVGAGMAVYGVVFAMLENDIRRLLSYHIVSQVGYMVCGIGIGTALALDGAAAHAVANVLYKGLLFMCAGALLHATGTTKLTELGGLLRSTRLTFAFYAVGALAISGVPPFNGFVSKGMLLVAAGEAHLGAIMLLLAFASVGTVLSVGLKLPYYAWIAGEPRATSHPVPAAMFAGMAMLALPCLLFGLAPGLLAALLPQHALGYHAYTVAHVFDVLLVGATSAAVFWLLRHRLRPHAALTLDFDWFYRRPAAVFVARVSQPLYRVYVRLGAAVFAGVEVLVEASRNPTAAFRFLLQGRGMGGLPSYDEVRQSPSVGAIVLWLLVVFAVAGASFLAVAGAGPG